MATAANEAATATTTAAEAQAQEELPASRRKKSSSCLADYIVTMTNNYISREATLVDSKIIELHGQSIVQDGVKLFGPLKISRYCFVDENTILEPARLVSLDDDTSTIVAMAVGAKTHIGQNCHVQAAAIGSYCWIGNNVTIGPRCILKDCVVVADGTTLPADTVVPPFSYISAPYGAVRVELPPSASMEWEEYVMDYYHNFVKKMGGTGTGGGGNSSQ
jgi:dynactin 5